MVFNPLMPSGELRDCSLKKQLLLGRFARTEIFYWDDSPETIRTSDKNVDLDVLIDNFKLQ